MPDRVPDLRLFWYALASAEHGSFRSAAAALNVRHSAISRGVRSLEHQVGAELFERDHAGIRPTPAGNRFLEEASQGFDLLARAMQRVRALQRGEQGELIVGVSAPFALIGDAFERFRQEQGSISIDIREATSSESWTRVQQRKIDIAFVTRSPAVETARSLHLREVPLFAVLPKDHRLARISAVALDELQREHVILRAGGVGPDVADYLARHTAQSESELRVRLHQVGQCDLLKMVGKGFGVTVIVGPLLSVAPDDTALVPLEGRHMLPLRAIWVESNPNPALRALLSILQQVRPGKTSEER